MGKKKLFKVAVPNRGEIALRVARACQEMGLKSVLLHSKEDEGSLSFRQSEERVCIGPAEPDKSYLNVEAVIQGALKVGADILHPGYGFLSENAQLAQACEKAGLAFVGPSPACLKLFGSKVLSRKKALQCRLPVLPSRELGLGDAASQILSFVKKTGWPVIVKSVYGGGGRGLRVLHSKKDLNRQVLNSAFRESWKACGSKKLFVEKYLPKARHIEVQVFGDHQGLVHYLYDRDCSLQRRHQKIVEEAPASGLSSSLKEQMKQAALALMEAVSYRQAGTMEFLVQGGEFYFMEFNPRLQVEHPVTEMTLGVDMVKAGLATTLEEKAFPSPWEVRPRGVSLECRIYAEDMRQGGWPVFGTLGEVLCPSGPGLRYDMGVAGGDKVPAFYDCMLGKAVVWEQDRPRALKKMRQALKQTVLFGLKTNLSFLQDLLDHPAVIKGKVSADFVEKEFLPHWREGDITSLPSEVTSTLSRAFCSSPREKNLVPPVKQAFNPWKI